MAQTACVCLHLFQACTVDCRKSSGAHRCFHMSESQRAAVIEDMS
ncbi:unnamed protein product [Mycena citricolor]|uniref:Uncharacterized protein n=1 Tax=Mycena citricolor TaxID=2018698 RepID=A0AAD2K8B7_9AGAR|nr:unnamed protein product [Mycena citricolor]CAK5284813.1 unnamed protein product [Mycena citricolor]